MPAPPLYIYYTPVVVWVSDLQGWDRAAIHTAPTPALRPDGTFHVTSARPARFAPVSPLEFPIKQDWEAQKAHLEPALGTGTQS